MYHLHVMATATWSNRISAGSTFQIFGGDLFQERHYLLQSFFTTTRRTRRSMTGTLVTSGNTTTDVMNAFWIESSLSPLGILPMFIRAVDDHVALVEVWLESVYGLVAHIAMWNTENEVLLLVVPAKTLAQLLVIFLVDNLLLC